MGPIVTEVENVDELLTRLETRKLQAAFVDDRRFFIPLGICNSDARAVDEPEFM